MAKGSSICWMADRLRIHEIGKNKQRQWALARQDTDFGKRSP